MLLPESEHLKQFTPEDNSTESDTFWVEMNVPSDTLK